MARALGRQREGNGRKSGMKEAGHAYETRRKERRKTERGKQVPLEEPKLPRKTHKLLQVLGGTAKRKKLLSPKGMDVRPMMEVVKGAAFDILQAASGCPASLRPGRWLDLYSGTGSVGIEALSWGCSEARNFRVEPPGLFQGRREHPKIGKLKRRIQPRDITINIGKDAPIPKCPIPSEKWLFLP
ncbi:uncharacterized protein LOC114263984 [Camellia sinensis]|uniref:uncharacterized protein LOC114263984 n=1 Tax=Camellia sinensis TaxID=4442 RepID=UPI001035F09C|nr:uncharacterized protein LOC114263984 [Camellia sinensis]